MSEKIQNPNNPITNALYGKPEEGILAKALREGKLGRNVNLPNQSMAEKEHWAEEYECAMMHLNDLDIPKDDGRGNTYSLVGRIDKAIDTRPNDAKAMIAEGLEKLREQPSWNGIIIHLGHAFSMSFNDVESILNNLFEVCKQSEGSEQNEEIL